MDRELQNWFSSISAGSSTATPTPPPTSVPTGTNVIPPQTGSSDSLHTQPTPPPTSFSSSSIPSSPLSNGQGLTNSYTTFTTSYPVIISQSSTTFTSYVTSVVTTSTVVHVSQTPMPQANLGLNSVCIGKGIDSMSIGLIAVALLSALVGFIIWVRPASDLQCVRAWLTSEVLTAVDLCYCPT